MISSSFQGPLSERRQPPASEHVHVPPRKSGNSLASIVMGRINYNFKFGSDYCSSFHQNMNWNANNYL